MIVLDASLALKLIDADLSSTQLQDAFFVAGGDEIHVPSHFKVELLSTIRGLYLTGKYTARKRGELFERVRGMPVLSYSAETLIPGIEKLTDNATVYDAAYLVLAQQLGCAFATADKRLAKMAASLTEVAIFEDPASL